MQLSSAGQVEGCLGVGDAEVVALVGVPEELDGVEVAVDVVGVLEELDCVDVAVDKVLELAEPTVSQPFTKAMFPG